MIKENKPMLVAILEPKVHSRRLESIMQEVGFDKGEHGGSINTHIWLMWSDNVTVSDLVWHERFVTFKIRHGPESLDFINCTIVYAFCDLFRRRLLWEDIIEKSVSIDDPWMVAGDFNSISDPDEKKGVLEADADSMFAFNSFIINAGLSDAGFQGTPYTWFNNRRQGRVWERLDRVLVNPEFMERFPNLLVKHLGRFHSDHSPLWITSSLERKHIAFFQFQKVWLSHPGFMDFVAEHWQGSLHNNPLVNFSLKLKLLRGKLREWNWRVFGNLKTKIRDLMV